MTKKQTLELLQKQMPSFYSLEQVIKIVSDIDETAQFALSEQKVKELAKCIYNKIESNLDALNVNDYVNHGSAEFSMNGNYVELECVDVDMEAISTDAMCGLEEEVEMFFQPAC